MGRVRQRDVFFRYPAVLARVGPFASGPVAEALCRTVRRKGCSVKRPGGRSGSTGDPACPERRTLRRLRCRPAGFFGGMREWRPGPSFRRAKFPTRAISKYIMADTPLSLVRNQQREDAGHGSLPAGSYRAAESRCAKPGRQDGTSVPRAGSRVRNDAGPRMFLGWWHGGYGL